MGYCLDLQHGWQILGDWLYNWQTLIAGTFAILGAAAVVQQTKQAKLQADQRFGARYLAARVTLPHRLTVICDYTQRMTMELARVHQTSANSGTNITVLFECPIIESDVVEQLEKAIEAIADPKINGLIADVVGELQILGSRAKQLSNPVGMTNWVAIGTTVEDYILQSVRLHIMAGNLFPFARREVDTIPEALSWDDVRSKMFMLGIYESDFPQMYKTMALRAERNPAFWPDNDR